MGQADLQLHGVELNGAARVLNAFETCNGGAELLKVRCFIRGLRFGLCCGLRVGSAMLGEIRFDDSLGPFPESIVMFEDFAKGFHSRKFRPPFPDAIAAVGARVKDLLRAWERIDVRGESRQFTQGLFTSLREPSGMRYRATSADKVPLERLEPRQWFDLLSRSCRIGNPRNSSLQITDRISRFDKGNNFSVVEPINRFVGACVSFRGLASPSEGLATHGFGSRTANAVLSRRVPDMDPKPWDASINLFSAKWFETATGL